MSCFGSFTSIWIVVVAASRRPGEAPIPVAIAALDVVTGRVLEIGMPKLRGVRHAPFSTGPKALVVSIDTSELVGCHLALGWRVPERIVDLLIEAKNTSNGQTRILVGGIAGAALAFGQPTAGLLVNGSSPGQLRQRLEGVHRLFRAMRSSLDLGRALLRGRYLCAVARIEAVGLPIDQVAIDHLREKWPVIRDRVIEIVDVDFDVYPSGHFSVLAFERWLLRKQIVWPRLSSRHLDLSDVAFREMARTHPVMRPLYDLRSTLTVFDPCALTIGRDGRNRTPIRPFASRTGRNQPSAKASVLGTASWVRHLIAPRAGTGLALLDWQQQEFGIAAALSGDGAMQTAYRSGDPYLALAISTRGSNGPSMEDTTRSHKHLRERFKACALGVQYGMGAPRLARLIDVPEEEALALMRAHKAAYPTFWSWMGDVETSALLHRELKSVFGWRLAVEPDANVRSLCNFPMQANGAEMLRLACCLITEAGIKVCAPIHDAVLIEAPLGALDATVHAAQRMMADASATVLDGFALRTSVKVARAPDRWIEPRGQVVWSAVKAALGDRTRPARQRHTTWSPANPRPISLYDYKKDSCHEPD